MVNLKAYLYEKIKPIIEAWNESDIYAISFFVYSNSGFSYRQYSNISELAISYNTEKDCDGASDYSEVRWNFAFWRQNTAYIIDPHTENDEGMETLFQWYEENGIENIGYECFENVYDENMLYIGKGPIGYYELLTVVSDVAREMQLDGFITRKFGRIPIIVHDFEYCWYVMEATAHANPGGEADIFLEAVKRGFDGL